MDPRLRIVSRHPLPELWDHRGPVLATRGADLDEKAVREHLRTSPRAVVAKLGSPLRWLEGTELFGWWKEEAHPRLVDPALPAWRLEDFPGERCWRASEWTLADGTTVMVFEDEH